MRIRTVLVSVAFLATACSEAGAGQRTVVASIYPLAFAADRITGPGWKVIDLTPPGTEAHDVELSLEDRAAIEDADLMLYLGDIGFQPQVEAAAGDAPGRVVAVTDGMDLMEGPGHEDGEGEEPEEAFDPHVWLDPMAFARIADRIGSALSAPGAAGQLRAELEELHTRYRDGLADCNSNTMVVSHEAFGYLADRYGLEQVGLAGLEPEGEPTADALREAAEVLATTGGGAVFYEAGEEARRIAETVASDAGVPALPLSTLESAPPEGDYLSVMEDNLGSLRRGLGCA
jgi:zinc transport system substrate-binding protein